MKLNTFDPEIANLIAKETARQNEGLEMIPSENHTSPAVLEALGTRLTDKYSEGYPGIRYYGGCEVVDKIENIARDRAKALFGVDHANVQPYSGSPANQAIYFALVNPGDKVMGMKLFFGGHMTHGLKVNFSGTLYESSQYGTGEDGRLDYDALAEQVKTEEPKLIFTGATAYPRIFDWARLRQIADSVGAWLVADISHIAGLVVGEQHPSPVGHAHVVMTTTHKTLRGPRGAIIMANGNPSTPLKAVERTAENIPTLIDRAVIPGLQGGPHNHQTAAIAVALKEAAQPEFKTYAEQVVKNAKALAETLLEHDFNLVTGGTDNHLILADLFDKNVSGKDAEKALGKAGITANKNTVPFDKRSPFDPSGIRMGTPALTTRGMKEEHMRMIGGLIADVIHHHDDAHALEKVHEKVRNLCADFPIYPSN